MAAPSFSWGPSSLQTLRLPSSVALDRWPSSVESTFGRKGVSVSPPEQPRASAVDFIDGDLVVHLEDGRTVALPLDWFPKLRDAASDVRGDWRLIGGGIGVRWPKLDEDLSVRALLASGRVAPRLPNV